MMMAGLQRSAQTFRRSGSSGLVWDERFLTQEDDAGRRRQPQQPELRHSRSVGSVAMLPRRGGGGGKVVDVDRDDKKRKLPVLARPNHSKAKDSHHRKQQELVVVPGTGSRKPFRTARDVAPNNAEPPSPRVPVGCCAPCAIFRDAGAGAGGGSSSSLPRRAKKR